MGDDDGGRGGGSNSPPPPSTAAATWWAYAFPCLPLASRLTHAQLEEAHQAAAERVLKEGFQMSLDAAGDWSARYAPRITSLSDQVTDRATRQPRATALQATLRSLKTQRRAAALYAVQWDNAHQNVGLDDQGDGDSPGSSSAEATERRGNQRTIDEYDAQISKTEKELTEGQRARAKLERVLRQWAKADRRWKGMLQRRRDKFNGAEFDATTRRRAIEQVSGWSHIHQDPEKAVICAWLHEHWQVDGKAKIDVGWWLKMTYFTDEDGSISDVWTSPGKAAESAGPASAAHDGHENGGNGLGLTLHAGHLAPSPSRDSGVAIGDDSGEKTARADSPSSGDGVSDGMVTANEWAEEGRNLEKSIGDDRKDESGLGLSDATIDTYGLYDKGLEGWQADDDNFPFKNKEANEAAEAIEAAKAEKQAEEQAEEKAEKQAEKQTDNFEEVKV